MPFVPRRQYAPTAGRCWSVAFVHTNNTPVLTTLLTAVHIKYWLHPCMQGTPWFLAESRVHPRCNTPLKNQAANGNATFRSYLFRVYRCLCYRYTFRYEKETEIIPSQKRGKPRITLNQPPPPRDFPVLSETAWFLGLCGISNSSVGYRLRLTA